MMYHFVRFPVEGYLKFTKPNTLNLRMLKLKVSRETWTTLRPMESYFLINVLYVYLIFIHFSFVHGLIRNYTFLILMNLSYDVVGYPNEKMSSNLLQY